MTHFERELSTLKRRVADMGAVAAGMVAAASEALFDAKPHRIPEVLAREPALDRCQIEIDREVIRLITIHAPVAHDLRFLLTIARVTSEIERIGDQAVDNAEYVSVIVPPLPPPADLAAMSRLVQEMVAEALRAFCEEDTSRARRVLARDDEVDEKNARVFQELLGRPVTDAAGRAAATSLILVARSLERIADHATNICEEIVYLVEASDIRHQAG